MKYEGFAELLRDTAGRFRERAALLYEIGGEKHTVTYGELYERVQSDADELKKQRCSCVALFAPVSPEWVVTMFASLLSGKRTVLLDISQPLETAKRLIAAAGADRLYTADSQDERELAGSLCEPTKCESEGEGRLLFFTSGTTASNKAVVLSTRALCYSAWNGQQMLPCSKDDVILSLLPLNHVFGFVCSLLWPLSQGAAVALGRGMRCFTLDPKYFEPTILPAVPSLIKYLLVTDSLNDKLRTVLVGASPCDKDTLAAIRARGTDVRFGYGLTETASGLAISLENEDPFAMALCPDTKLRLGEDGEIFVKTSCMMDGYYNNKEATDAVLRDGELATGDVGRLDENGRLHITGRKNDVFILPNGNKVYCVEWEQTLDSLLCGETVVMLKNGHIALVAVTQLGEDEAWKKVEWFNGTQPIDRRIAQLQLRNEPLPRTATGKLKRWAI